jgi:hypothetical protein
MSTVFDREEEVIRNRKQPKEISSKAKTARAVFEGQARKDLPIPILFDTYNH